MKYFASSLLLALSLAAQAEKMPYTVVSPYDIGDTKKIIVLMKYDCPYCREYHLPLESWGKSIPQGYHVEFMPILERSSTGFTPETVGPFVIYHGLEESKATDDQLQAFSEAAYAIEQDSHTANDRKAWTDAAKVSGLPPGSIANGIVLAEQNFADNEKRMLHYAPVATPTIIVCGKYKFTPDDASGVPSIFMQLLNATLSKCMIDQGVAK